MKPQTHEVSAFTWVLGVVDVVVIWKFLKKTYARYSKKTSQCIEEDIRQCISSSSFVFLAVVDFQISM